MNNRILIVDDDDDFRLLLSDLYTQADYQVKAIANPIDALKLLTEEQFSLCVTDQSMPELKGVDFIDKIRAIKPNLPVIMVSAYLGEEVAEKLKTLRIEVFHKPLNIMSLLRKTSELIKNAQEESNSSPPVDNTLSNVSVAQAANSVVTPSKSKFKSYPFKSDASKRLRKEIESIGGEIPNIVLVGDKGTHFQQICEDVERHVAGINHRFLYLSNRKTNVFDISKVIGGVPNDTTLVFALTEAQEMGVAQKQALLKLHKKSGPFGGLKNPVKFIFCLNEDLDTQFANGSIDQDFYLIMGQKEIYVPRLDLCKEDIPDLAKTAAKRLIETETVKEKFGGFHDETSEWFINNEWDLNYFSLESTVAKALNNAKGNQIRVEHLDRAFADPSSINVESTETQSTELPGATMQAAVESSALKSTQTSGPEKSPEPQFASNPVASPTENRNEASKSKVAVTNGTTNVATSPAPKPKRKRPPVENPIIQSFTMLDDETELAKSIFEELSG